MHQCCTMYQYISLLFTFYYQKNSTVQLYTFALSIHQWMFTWDVSVFSCVQLFWDPMNWSLLGFSVHGISQTRILEWVAISNSRGSSWPRNWTQPSRIAGRFFTVWATRYQIRIKEKDMSLCLSRALVFTWKEETLVMSEMWFSCHTWKRGSWHLMGTGKAAAKHLTCKGQPHCKELLSPTCQQHWKDK